MNRPASVFLLAALLLAGVASAQDYGVPSGSYQQTCRNAFIQFRPLGDDLYYNRILVADCRRTDGSFKKSDLHHVGECGGDISNQNGTLACPKDPPPQGSYTRTCRGIQQSGTTLTAECRDRDGFWRPTHLYATDRCVGPIHNEGGALVCEYDPAGLPPGSYRQSCVNTYVTASGLHAGCLVGAGSLRLWNRNFDFTTCRTPVSNVFGNLSCGRGTTIPPAGSYTASCHNPTTTGTLLEATCKRTTNQWNEASLNQFATCSLDISNENGFLRCHGAKLGTQAHPDAPPVRQMLDPSRAARGHGGTMKSGNPGVLAPTGSGPVTPKLDAGDRGDAADGTPGTMKPAEEPRSRGIRPPR